MHAKVAFEVNDDEVIRQEKEQKVADQFKNLANMYNDFKEYRFCDIEGIVDMQRFDLLNGYVVVPCDWIPLNVKRAAQSQGVYVMEIWNAKELKIPHYLYFSEQKEINDSEKTVFYSLVRKNCPDFKICEERQVEPIYGMADEQGRRELLNKEDFEDQPIIGIFEIPDDGERDRYPYSAKIFRKEK